MLVGYLGNAVLPARLGEVVRSAVVARREGLASAEALGSAVLERVLDVFVLAILGVLAVTALAAPEWVGTAAATTAIAAAAALVLLGGGALIAARQRGRDATSSAAPGPARALLGTVSRLVVQLTRGARIVDRPGLIAAGIALTIVAWLLDASVFWLVGLSLGLAISPPGAMLVSALAVLSTAIPTAPGYVGTFELAAVVALGVSGVTGEPALAFAVLAHVMAVIPLSLAGTAALWLVGGTAARRGIGEQAPARH
jgi:hypothetical protein